MTQLRLRFQLGKLGEYALLYSHGMDCRSCRGSRPSELSNRASSPGSGFGVVNSFSPIKRELAPATKQRATASRERDRRPALRRTIEDGIRIRAVAIMRTKTSGS